MPSPYIPNPRLPYSAKSVPKDLPVTLLNHSFQRDYIKIGAAATFDVVHLKSAVDLVGPVNDGSAAK